MVTLEKNFSCCENKKRERGGGAAVWWVKHNPQWGQIQKCCGTCVRTVFGIHCLKLFHSLSLWLFSCLCKPQSLNVPDLRYVIAIAYGCCCCLQLDSNALCTSKLLARNPKVFNFCLDLINLSHPKLTWPLGVKCQCHGGQWTVHSCGLPSKQKIASELL